MAMVVARNVLVADPIWKTVRLSTGTPAALLRTPKPLAYIRRSPATMPMASPGASNAFIPLWMYASRSGINALTRDSMTAMGLDASSARATFNEDTPESMPAIKIGRKTFLTQKTAFNGVAKPVRTMTFLWLCVIMIAALPCWTRRSHARITRAIHVQRISVGRSVVGPWVGSHQRQVHPKSGLQYP